MKKNFNAATKQMEVVVKVGSELSESVKKSIATTELQNEGMGSQPIKSTVVKSDSVKFTFDAKPING